MDQMKQQKNVQISFVEKATSNAAVVHAFQKNWFVIVTRIVLMDLMKETAQPPRLTSGDVTMASVSIIGMFVTVISIVMMSLMKKIALAVDSHAIQVNAYVVTKDVTCTQTVQMGLMNVIA